MITQTQAIAIPESMRRENRWVLWSRENGTKTPKTAAGGNAKSSDPTTWTTYDQAVQVVGRFDGLGFVLGDGWSGVDLDNCRDASTGTIARAALEIVQQVDSYAEVSPSGNGLKIFTRGKHGRDKGVKQSVDWWASTVEGEPARVEAYDAGRYFCVTGWHLPDTPSDPLERGLALSGLVARLAPPAPAPRNGTARQHVQRTDAAERAAKYVAKMDPAVSGQGGHAATFRVAATLYWGFGLDDCQGLALLAEYNARCEPPWSEHELQHKWESCQSDQYSDGKPRGWKLAEERDQQKGPTPWEPDLSGTTDEDDEPPAEVALIPLGERDPKTGRLVLSAKRTLPTAEAFIREYHQHKDGPTLKHYAGLLMRWNGGRWAELEPGKLNQRLQVWLHKASRYVTNRKTNQPELVCFESNAGTIRGADAAIRAYCHLDATTASPSWLSNSVDGLDASDLLPCKSVLLHLPTGKTIPATPKLWNTNALDFDPQSNAPKPERWYDFLAQLWPADEPSIQLLQEWFGYCLTGDTRQQKMLLMVGPKRSGKGTIARILTHLVGADNVDGPTTGGLAGSFGLQPLIGKSLAIVSDARFHGPDIPIVVERLLCISGEDSLSIGRKHLPSVTMKLPTRFVFLSNELPRLADASGALAGRFVMLRLTESFFGREDKDLTDKLLVELPGILNWALEGLHRLRRRGRFVMPDSVRDVVEELADLGSPVSAFLRDTCAVGPGHRVAVDALYEAWGEWCKADGRDTTTTKQRFGRDLRAAVPGLTTRRSGDGQRFFEGIGIRSAR